MNEGTLTSKRAAQAEAAWWGVRSITLYRAVLDAPVGRSLTAFLQAVAEGDPGAAYDARYAMEAELLAADGPHLPRSSAGLWPRWLVDAVLMDDNPFTRRAEREGPAGIGPELRRAAARDLAVLGRLARLDVPSLLDGLDGPWTLAFAESSGDGARPGAGAADPGGTNARIGGEGEGEGIAGRMLQSSSWSELVDELAEHYRRHGVGDMARYAVFRWRRRGERGMLEGVAEPDPIRLADLVGYDTIREPVLRNTVQFLQGLPANNVLLYGDRGTGKSATVKAILNEYRDRGLRMVELPRPHFKDLGDILALLKGRPQRFILFIDDLSFEEDETDYKYLKALLEGSVEARPDNVLVYATSNRRHLVRERFSDEGRPDPDEKRREDTVQEKLSLADRFGMTVVFPSPDQEGYLRIVEGIASREGLEVDAETLRKAAARWVLWNNERSARTARQFVDDFKGQLALGAD